MAVNAYRTPAFYGLNRLIFTNTTPGTAYRGAGRPSVSYLIERLVDEAARQSCINRIELRRRNLLRSDAFPYQTPTGSTYDSGDPQALLAQALELADWDGFERRRAAAKARGLQRCLRRGSIGYVVSANFSIVKAPSMLSLRWWSNARQYSTVGQPHFAPLCLYPSGLSRSIVEAP